MFSPHLLLPLLPLSLLLATTYPHCPRSPSPATTRTVHVFVCASNFVSKLFSKLFEAFPGLTSDSPPPALPGPILESWWMESADCTRSEKRGFGKQHVCRFTDTKGNGTEEGHPTTLGCAYALVIPDRTPNWFAYVLLFGLWLCVCIKKGK